jgi:antitoxin component YwqK of YwqJK toxin-antitoxin module
MRLLFILISFGLLISSSFAYSQDYSKNIESFKSEVNSNKKAYAFTYKLPSDGYYFQISTDSTVVPFAIYIKYGELEFWSGFEGKAMKPYFTQRDLTLEEKVKFIGIQPPLVRSTLETKIKSSKPDPAKNSGGIEGEKYLVIDQNGTKIAVVKKIGENMFQFRSKTNVPLIDNHSKENEIIFRDNYIKSIYKELNVDPSKQSFVITKGKERDRRDKGICILVDKPSDFYLDYFAEMNSMNRNFIGELIVYKQENKLLEEINASIISAGGKEITSLFQNGDDVAEKTTEKIARGEVAYLDGIKSYGKILETDKRFSFQKKDGLEELIILVFSPLENSTFNVNLNQSPEGINQVYYKSGQLKEKYTLQNGKLNGEKITYYEDKNYKIGQDAKPIKEITTYLNGSKTGVHKEYDLNQNLVLEEELKDGIKNGKYKKCVNGKVIKEGNYVNNEKEGEWTTLNSSEKITQNYSKGKLNGAYKKYDGAVLRESGQYVEGMKNGEWKAFNRLGEIKLIENFNAGILNGPFNKYNNTDGQAKVVYKNPNDQFNCDESMLNMLKHLMFYVETIANKYLYVDIVKGGIIKIANDGYTQEEKDLINGEIDRWVSFSNISNDKRSSDLNYDYGKSQDWSIRFPGKPLPKISNGLIEKGQYVDGLKNGEWNYFDNEGKLTLIQNYKLGKLDGAFKKYSGDVLIEEGTYSNGLKNGKFEFLLENGTKRNATYINDVLSKMTISCPELTSELQKLPKCIVDISINDDLSSQYQAIEFMIKGDNYLKQGDHENALYSYRDGIKKYKFQALFDRIVPLGDYCYEMKHSGHVQDAYEHYLLTKRDENRQNKFNVSKAKSDVVMTELYESLEEIVDDMNEVVTERKTISYSNEKNKETRNEASKNCDTYIYICNDCSKMFSSKSEPNDRTTCPEPRWMGINSPFHDGKHQWQKIGRCGSDNYYCKGCGNRISVSEKPARGTCGSKGNNCCSHNWLED